MDNISIKDHPPWYARGTPVINPRDGPPMASSEISLFAIRKGPSARGEPKDKTHRWLTLKKSLFDAVRSKDADRSGGNFDLSACEAPDNVKLEMDDNVKKSKRRMNCIATNFN
jgi:hypothetical protein